jgi:hypothetical protein
MRPTNSSSGGYQPGDPPSDPAQLQSFLREELAKMKVAIDALAAGHLNKSYVVPAKPRDGDIRYADGASFKPNGVGGAGIWFYNGTSWAQLG